MKVVIILVILTATASLFFLQKAIKNAPLQCGKCQYLIPITLKSKCPCCGYDNDSYRRLRG